jgi:lipopolysaccharide/colanic/teichoic acid biosynthesis glycosyltransferase
MQAIVIRERGNCAASGGTNLLRYGLSTNPLNRVLLEGMDHLWRCRKDAGPESLAGWTSPRDSQWILPRSWCAEVSASGLSIRSSDEFQIEDLPQHEDRWIVVTDGRFATCVNHHLLAWAVDEMQADVIAVNADPRLLAYRERARLTPDNQLVGYRRLFADSIAPMPMPAQWPHHLLIRSDAWNAVFRPNLPAGFDAVIDECRAKGLRMRGIAVAGTAFDLESEDGILAVCRTALELSAGLDVASRPGCGLAAADRDSRGSVCDAPRVIGPVAMGRQVTMEPGALIVGPAILCDDCTVGRNAVIDSSIVGARVSVESGGVLRSRLVGEPWQDTSQDRAGTVRRGMRPEEHLCARQETAFRTWSRFSYAGMIKRMADVSAAAVVLTLFAPVIPVIALAVRISSPGPIFFRDKRQGLHGKLFDCIKFRTMRQGADKMQDKLRFVCEVDGPQFKITDDPRITGVGRFLRETYLDEIPQFFNVLCGQMSVVGPRPSPEFENTLCASWRDARLSVRPGITGLWQVCRTRVTNKDFQEWIHYDTKYIRDLSPTLDLWICWRTFRRMVENFVNQF